MEIKLLQKERNSSFELLRIISMFLIVMHHYSFHGGFDFMIPFSMKLYFVQCLDMGGKLGVNLFVLISGYFLCKSDFKWKRIIKLEVEVIFYSILIGVIFHFLMPERESIKDLIKELTPLMTESYGFYNTYFVMVLFAPFINKFLVSLEKADLKKNSVFDVCFVGVDSCTSKSWCPTNVKSWLVYFSLSLFCLY